MLFEGWQHWLYRRPSPGTLFRVAGAEISLDAKVIMIIAHFHSDRLLQNPHRSCRGGDYSIGPQRSSHDWWPLMKND